MRALTWLSNQAGCDLTAQTSSNVLPVKYQATPPNVAERRTAIWNDYNRYTSMVVTLESEVDRDDF